jgi:predicted dehydrogenase
MEVGKMEGRVLVRVGILGQGRSGRDIHAEWLSRSAGKYRIVAVSDLLRDRRDRAVREFECDAYADYKELLARQDLDLIVNALPSHLHTQGTVEAFGAGHHVVSEKPVAASTREFRRMVAASGRAGRVFAPFQQSRYAPHFQQIRRVIDSGVLGRIVQIRIAFNGFARRWDWQTLQEFKGGNLLNTGPHPMDQALCLLDWKKPAVHCIMDRTNTYGDAEDHVKVLLRRKGSPTVDLEISSCDAYSRDMYHVYGTRGGLAGGSGGIRWRFFDPAAAPEQRLLRSPLPGPSYCREELPWTEKTWAPNEVERDAFTFMSRAFYDHIYRVLREGAPLFITPKQVAVQVAVMEECHRQNPLSRWRPKGWKKES